MSMSAPFDPEQQGSDVPVDGSDSSDSGTVSSSAEADASAERLHEEDEAGGGPVFRRPQPGDRADVEDLSEELSEDGELDS